MAEAAVKRERQQQQQQQQARVPNPRPILPRGTSAAGAGAADAAAPAPAPISANVRFDFADIDGVSVPRVYRGDSAAFVAVWMVELKLLWRFPNNYPQELKRRPPLRSSYMTDDEATLINEINETHCLCEYGAGHDFRKRDNMLVKYEEFMQFYLAVRHCFPDIADNLAVGVAPDELRQMKGGFVQVNNTVCPYVYRKDMRFVPLSHLQHTGIRLGLPARLDGFGYNPSPKECAFVNTVSARLGLKAQVGTLGKMLALDTVQRLSDCAIRDLSAANPFATAQFVVAPAEMRLAGQPVRVQQQQQQQQQSAGLFNVMAVGNAAPSLIGMAPVVSAPAPTPAAAAAAAAFAGGNLQMQASQTPPLAGANQRRGSTPANQLPTRGQTRQRARAADQQQQQQQHHHHQQQQQQQPASKRRRTGSCEPQIAKQIVRESRLGVCSLVRVQGDLSGGRQLCLLAIRPHSALLPENTNQGDYVVLEQVAASLFTGWSAEKLISVLRCLVAGSKFYKMAPELQQLFQDAFGVRLQPRANTLLHLEILLKNLHYLHCRYAESQPLTENQLLSSLPRQQPAKQPLPRQPVLASVQSVLGNIGLSSQLPAQLADIIHID